MGSRGPAPKRIQERLGHITKAQKKSVSTVVMTEPVKVPPLPRTTHPVARRWYHALRKSGQTQYFEPSDWAAALYVAEAMTRNLEATRFSAQMFGVVWSAMDDLLSTEAARRRVRIEIERVISMETPEGITAIDEYKKALGVDG